MNEKDGVLPMQLLLPAELNLSTVLENVSTLIHKLIAVLVFNNRAAIRMTKNCFGVGTRFPWVAGIDIYAMVTKCVLPHQAILPITRSRLLLPTLTRKPKGLSYRIHGVILDSTLLRMITESVSPLRITRIKPELKFGPMIAILWRRVSAGNGVICSPLR